MIGGGSVLGIGVTMFLRDQFSGPASRIKASAKSLEQDMLKVQTDQLRQQRNMYTGLAIGGGMALRGMGRMVKKASEFGYEMQFVKSVSDATVEEQKALVRVAKELGRQTMFDPQDIAEGMRYMAMAGMSAKEVQENIKGATALAGATMSELGGKGGTADIMTNVMKQFSIGFEYSAHVADLLAYGANKANTDVFDLGEAIKYAGATSMDLGVSLEETIAMVMALGNAGIKGSMAGVSMENAMRYLSRAFTQFGSGPSQKALAEVGLGIKDVTDQKGNLLTMTEIMTKMGKAINTTYGEGMNLQKQSVLQNIFGVRGKRAASLFIRNLEEFSGFTNDISTNSAGQAQRVMVEMMTTLYGEFDKVKSSWESMWVSFTEKITPVVTVLTKALTGLFSVLELVFDSKIIGGFLANGLMGFLVLKTATFAYRAVVSGLRLLHLESASSATTMANVTTAAYNKMTASATAYAASTRMAGWGNVRTTSIGGLGNNTKAGLVGRNSVGRLVRTSAGKTGGAGTFVGGAVAARYLSRFGAKGVAQTGASTVLKGVLGRAIGVLGGPVGMALSFVLPGLIGGVIDAVRSSKDATNENTKKLEESNRQSMVKDISYTRMGHMIQFQDLASPQLNLIGQTTANQLPTKLNNEALKSLANQLEKLLQSKQTQPINIYVDGELSMKKFIEKNIADSLISVQ